MFYVIALELATNNCNATYRRGYPSVICTLFEWMTFGESKTITTIVCAV